MKIDAPILKRLGPVPFWRGQQKCLEELQRMYQKAMASAQRLTGKSAIVIFCLGLASLGCAERNPPVAWTERDGNLNVKALSVDGRRVNAVSRVDNLNQILKGQA